MKIISILVFTMVSSLSYAKMTANEIIKKANLSSYYLGNDGRAKVSMLIKDDQGRKRKRSFVILRKNVGAAGGDQKFYVYFNRPSDVKGMAFLVFKKVNASEDDRWLYLPAMDLVKRIAGSDKRTSFVGSSYFYEDVSGRNVNADTHKLVGEEPGQYIIESIPKNAGDVEFSKFKTWVDKKNFLPMKSEYFDKSGKVYRRHTIVKTEVVQGYSTATLSKMEDLKTGSETLNKYGKIQFDAGISEDIFSERYLRKPPEKYLK